MQGNDLASYVSQRHVVILTPTLFIPPEPERFDSIRRRLHKNTVLDDAAEYKLNELMVRWITGQGYTYNIPTEVWGFEGEDLFDDLCERLLAVCDRYIFRTIRWDSEDDARADLMANLPSITRVYDADVDRVERLWTFNGLRVLQGDHP